MALTSKAVLDAITVDDPRVHPDGGSVAWLQGDVDAEHDRTRVRVLVRDLEGGPVRELVAPSAGVRAPRWSPDGLWLAFLVRVGDATEVHVVPASGGPARAATALGAPLADFTWAPGSDAFALVVPRHVGPEPAAGPVAGVLRVTRLRWKRDGAGLIGDRFDHLATVPFAADGSPAVAPRWLVEGRVDVAGPKWSPDGTRLAFVAALDEPDWERGRRASLYVVDAHAEAPRPRALAAFADVRAQAIAWSPDGRRLAVTGHDHEGIGHYGAQRLWWVDAAGGGRRAVTDDRHGTFGNAAYSDTGGSGDQGPMWTPDGRSLVAVLSLGSSVRLVRIDLPTGPGLGQVVPLTSADCVVAGFDLAPDGLGAVVVAQPVDRSADLEHVTWADAGGATPAARLTDVGAACVGSNPVRLPEHFVVDDGDGPALDAWAIVPDRSEGERVPVILYCGGGPGGMRAANLHLEWQVFAAAGYAVVWANTRGCQGYGDDFCTAILGSWGGADAHDNLRALDAALARFPELDPDRQAIAGGSYGGFQVVWAIGSTRRFRAAVADRSVVDKLAAFGMSDIGPQRAFEFGGGRPWEDPEAYLRQSPIQRLAGATTPTLVVHSAQDHRCTVGQGEALYGVFRTLGVPTRLVRFPNESHGLSRGGRPWHRVRRLQEYLDWFARYLAPAEPYRSGDVERAS